MACQSVGLGGRGEFFSEAAQDKGGRGGGEREGTHAQEHTNTHEHTHTHTHREVYENVPPTFRQPGF